MWVLRLNSRTIFSIITVFATLLITSCDQKAVEALTCENQSNPIAAVSSETLEFSLTSPGTFTAVGLPTLPNSLNKDLFEVEFPQACDKEDDASTLTYVLDSCTSTQGNCDVAELNPTTIEGHDWSGGMMVVLH